MLPSWSLTLRCLAADVSPSLEVAGATTLPYRKPEQEPNVTVRNNNGTQFTYVDNRGIDTALDLQLLRTAYRPQGGRPFIEQTFRWLNEESIWTSDSDHYGRAHAARLARAQDCSNDRLHASLGERTSSRTRAEAAQH